MTRQQELLRQVGGSLEPATATQARLETMKRVADRAPAVPASVQADVRTAIKVNEGVLEALRGDAILTGRNEATPPSINGRVSVDMGRTLGAPTAIMVRDLDIAEFQFAAQRASLRTLVQETIPKIEAALVKAGAPYSPGRLP